MRYVKRNAGWGSGLALLKVLVSWWPPAAMVHTMHEQLLAQLRYTVWEWVLVSAEAWTHGTLAMLPVNMWFTLVLNVIDLRYQWTLTWYGL